MGFLSGLFGKKAAPARKLSHPNDLLKGDMLTLDDSFALPSQLRKQQLRVEGIHTYEYERNKQAELLLRGNSDRAIFMSYIEEDDPYLSISIKITRADVEDMFEMDEFALLFEEPGHAILNTKGLPAELENELGPWLSEQYHQVEFAKFGYFHRQDYRTTTPPQAENAQHGDQFESYSLINSDETHAIDVEVYEGGETEVMLTLYRPLSDIREYWPGS
ncbi:hypothetical protein ACFOD0_05385 [Shewanella intestini]|uniref:DUF4178 domain-containing protein n=1 Tax=Shewanella intestini TaxID=2017544 RepID=A0ABS5I141_9GAMM|nr:MULTISPECIES: hypothetical protein [Shewanella]MBR9727734.1 hypothetical protein [Shewanella intestini]MRG35116.1 hypothetical protein [Shewanella sp. XMDDZSB0408]